uniref:Uncharacterized protein n=1 Tax=Setaria italica TaxID=4555 RepID=K4ANY4_SETIT
MPRDSMNRTSHSDNNRKKKTPYLVSVKKRGRLSCVYYSL